MIYAQSVKMKFIGGLNMKRIISLVLTLVLLFVCFVPMQAAAVSDIKYDLLQYSLPFGFSSNSGFTSDKVVGYPLPATQYVQYIDVIVSLPYQTLSAAYIADRGNISSLTSLNIISLGNYMYRIYGNYRVTRANIYLYFDITSDMLDFNFFKFDVYGSNVESSFTTGSLYTTSVYGNSSVSMTNSTTPVTTQLTYEGGTASYSSTFNTLVYLSDWRNYDRMSVILDVSVASIDSISAVIDTTPVPIDVSYFLLDNGSYVVVNDLSGVVPDTVSLIRNARIILDIDLSGIIRNSHSGNLEINIDGTYYYTRGSQSITLYRVLGYLDLSYVDPIIFAIRNLTTSVGNWFTSLGSDLSTWFGNLTSSISTGLTALGNSIYDYFVDLTNNLDTWFQTQFDKFDQLINGSSESNQAAEDFQDQAAEQDQQLDEMTQIMDSVEKPDPGDINMDLSTVVDSDTITLATTGLSAALGNTVILKVLIMAITFALIGFVLYGKR